MRLIFKILAVADWHELWEALGGRKNVKTYVATALITWYAWYSEAKFTEYWPPILVALGIMAASNVIQKATINGHHNGAPKQP